MNVANEYRCSEDPLLSAREVSEQYPLLTKAMLWRWSRMGKVPFVELPSGRKFFRRSDIEALLRPVDPDVGEGAGVPFVDAPLPGFEVEAVPA